MQLSELLNILNNIYNDFGDLSVDIYYDPRQSESLVKDPQGINIDDIKTIQIGDDGKVVHIANRYSWIDEYNGCKGEVFYNPETKQYEGRIIPEDHIEGFDTSFVSPDKYQIEKIFKSMVDKYNDFMGKNKINKTMEAINKIMNFGQDVKYESDKIENTKDDYYEVLDDDEDYGEI